AAAAGAAAAASRVEELDVVSDDLRGPALLAVLAFPRARLDATLDVNEGALARVLGHDLGQISLAGVVGDDVVVVGELFLLAVRSAGPAIGGDAEVGHRRAAWRVPHLRVLGQPADAERLVQVGHLCLLLSNRRGYRHRRLWLGRDRLQSNLR